MQRITYIDGNKKKKKKNTAQMRVSRVSITCCHICNMKFNIQQISISSFSSLSLDVTRVYSNLYYSFGFIHFTIFSYFILLVYNVLSIRNTLETYYIFFLYSQHETWIENKQLISFFIVVIIWRVRVFPFFGILTQIINATLIILNWS